MKLQLTKHLTRGLLIAALAVASPALLWPLHRLIQMHKFT